jgi:hypothetical protein
MNIHVAEPLVLEPSLAKVGVAVEELKKHKSLHTVWILAKLVKAGGETFHSEIHMLICSIWQKEELPQQQKEFSIAPIYSKGDKMECNNYQGISLLSTAHKISINIPLKVDSEFCHDTSATDQIFYI